MCLASTVCETLLGTREVIMSRKPLPCPSASHSPMGKSDTTWLTTHFLRAWIERPAVDAKQGDLQGQWRAVCSTHVQVRKKTFLLGRQISLQVYPWLHAHSLAIWWSLFLFPQRILLLELDPAQQEDTWCSQQSDILSHTPWLEVLIWNSLQVSRLWVSEWPGGSGEARDETCSLEDGEGMMGQTMQSRPGGESCMLNNPSKLGLVVPICNPSTQEAWTTSKIRSYKTKNKSHQSRREPRLFQELSLQK
jgi:hypothetical protein